MKRILLALLLLPALAFGGANDILMNQRNNIDSGTLGRIVAIPPGGQNGLLGFNGATVLPQFFTLGSGLTLTAGVLDTAASSPTWASISGKPNFAPVATSGAYADLTGVPTTQPWSTITGTPTTLAGYGITDAASSSALAGKFNVPTGTVAQYLRGDGTVATFPTLVSAFGNDLGYLTGISSAQVTGALGFTPYNATNPAGYVTQSGARSSISLTTTGTSGAATYNSSTGVLNVPAYAAGTGTVTSVTAGTGLSGGTITTSGTISLPNTGTAGTYANVTTDAQGRVTAGTNRAFANPARALNTAFQISATRDAAVSYTVDISVTSLILAGTSGRVYLEYADDSGMTTNVVTVNSSPNATGGVLNVTNLGSGNVAGWIPAGKYARIRTTNVTGTPTFTFQGSQEVLQ